ncbi:MAG: RNA polymerase sigma factor [Spongiibacteraceae bacterium]
MAILQFGKSREKAFKAFVDRHAAAVYRTAYRLTGQQQEAEDLFQDLLVKLYAMDENWDRLENPGAWLSRVISNLYIDQCRVKSRAILRNANTDEGALDSEVANYGDPEQAADQASQQRELKKALDTLKPEDKSLVILHLVEGRTLESLTEVFDLPLGTLKSRLRRIKAQLKKVINIEPFSENPRL